MLCQNVNRHLFALVLCCACLWTSHVAAETDNTTQNIAPCYITTITHLPSLHPGSTLSYTALSVIHPLRPPIKENYTVTIDEIWRYGVRFAYNITQSVLGTATGFQTLSSLDTCSKIDPWWEDNHSDFDDRCELWISRQNYFDLMTDKKTYIAVDTEVRKDSVVRLEFIDYVDFPCTVHNAFTLLPAFRVRSSRNDTFIILDNPDNPLILSAESAYFSWHLDAIN